MFNKILKKAGVILFAGMVIAMPLVSWAQEIDKDAVGGTITDICAPTSAGKVDLTKLILFPACLISKAVIPLLISLMIVLLFWGVIRIVWDRGEKGGEMRKQMFDFLGWAVFGLFVMLSVWGIVFVISRTLGVGVGGTGAVPQLYQGE